MLLSYIDIARKFGIIDKPDERKNHKFDTVRGGGIVLVISTILYSAFYMQGVSIPRNSEMIQILIMFFLIGLLFFIEDIKEIRSIVRFGMQLTMAALATYACQDKAMIFPHIHPYVNFALVTIGWVWFMNLYNFMDGADGITATNSLFFASSIMAVIYLFNINAPEISTLCRAIIPGFLAFLMLNWHPARIFIGDSGSIAFGFLFGYIFLSTAFYVGLVAPILLCSYYLCDASITIMRRIMAKENILMPHSKHFFQIAMRGGMSPKVICTYIMITNICLFFLVYLILHKNNLYTVSFGVLSSVLLNIFLLKTFYSLKPKKLSP